MFHSWDGQIGYWKHVLGVPKLEYWKPFFYFYLKSTSVPECNFNIVGFRPDHMLFYKGCNCYLFLPGYKSKYLFKIPQEPPLVSVSLDEEIFLDVFICVEVREEAFSVAETKLVTSYLRVIFFYVVFQTQAKIYFYNKQTISPLVTWMLVEAILFLC